MPWDDRYYWKDASVADRWWPVRWSMVATISRTRLPQIVSLIPILGYAVIWSDDLQRAIMRFDVALPHMWFTAVQRIHMLYAGSVLVFIGVCLFWMFAPRVVRRHDSPDRYALAVAGSGDVDEMRSAYDNLSTVHRMQSPPYDNPKGQLFGLYDARSIQASLTRIMNADARYETLLNGNNNHVELTKIALLAHYRYLDRQRPSAALASFALLIIGGLICSLPAIEVFWHVLTRLPVFMATSIGLAA
jgi:hypothetical protein